MKNIRNAAKELQNLTVDITSLIPTNNGNMFNIYFDNGATTPPMESVIKAIEEYTPWYKYVGNNSLKADILAELYNKGRATIKQYVGADMEQDIAIYTKNSTEAINILSNVIAIRYQGQNPVVITSYMEHLSNYLPWKYRFETVLADVLPDGRLSLTDLEQKLWKYRGRVKLVAITGASNVTGYVNPIHDIARMAHRYSAEIFVDGAQLVQHRKICMRSLDSTERIDYLSFSAHKIYAPAYSGVLIGPQKIFDNALPLYFGAGMESLATDQQVIFKPGPERYEGGSNNLLGAIALSCALLTIKNTGINTIRKHESGLLAYGINLLSHNPNVILYGDTRCLEDRIPIISFNVQGRTYQETADYLYANYGIITKNGLCGADLYVQKLTQETPFDGIVRVSMAFFNQCLELDRLSNALKQYQQT